MSVQAAPFAAAPAPVSRRAVAASTVLIIASLGVFMEFVDSTIVNIAFPAIHKSFPHSSYSTLSWVFNAYSIVFAAFLVVSGRIADLLGRKRMFEGGIALFTLASALCSLAPSVNALIAARALQALGGAIVVPSSLALVINAFPPSARSQALTTYGASAALAAALGPPIGGLLIKLADWRLCFLVNLPIGIAVFLVARSKLVESRSPGRRTLPDLTGAMLLAGSLVLLTLGIVRGPDWGWVSPAVLGAFGVALAFGAAFGWRSSWHRSPVVDFALLRARRFSMANAAISFAGVGFYAYLLCHALFLILVWRYSELQAGLSFIPAALIAAVVAAAAGRLADRRGFRVIIVPGALIWALSLFWYRTQVGLHPDWIGEWLPGALLTGVGAGLTLPQIGAAAIAAAPGTRYATAAALNTTARQLGGALGIALVIVIIGAPGPSSLRDGWVFSGTCFVLVALLALGVAGRSSAAVDESAAQPVDDAPPRPAPPRPSSPVPATPAEAGAVNLLRSARLFAGLSHELLEKVADALRPVSLAAGEWLFRQDDPADGLYVVEVGRLEVIHDGAPGSVLRELGRGEVIGELALLTGAGRSASIRTRRDSELQHLPLESFEALLSSYPELARALARGLAGQLQHSRILGEQPGSGLPRVIAVLWGEGDDVLAERLCVQVEQEGGASRLSACEPAARAGVLDRAERTGACVLLLCRSDVDSDSWREFCLRQADRSIFVGSVPAGVQIDGSRTQLLLERREHVRDHAAAAHIAWGADGAARLARAVQGRATGLVLSGGGARALAHIGVLDHLEAAGVDIDRFGGTGMGALIGAMAAAGMPAGQIDAHCYDELIRRNPFGDVRPSRTGLIAGRRLEQALDRIFGELQIEELPRSFFCLSADLMRGKTVVHRSGPVRDALRAALTVPGLMAPVPDRGRLLVDAGAVDNLPVQTMAEQPIGPIIAVDVSGRTEGPALIESARRGASDGTGTPALPSLREALARNTILGSLDQARHARELAWITIEPDGEGAGAFEFHQLDVLREAGRKAAEAALAGP